MTDDATLTLTLRSENHLRVLQRVLHEVQFALETEDGALAGSPIVADLYRDVMSLLRRRSVDQESCDRWLTLPGTPPHTRELQVAEHRVRACASWPTWTDSERIRF